MAIKEPKAGTRLKAKLDEFDLLYCEIARERFEKTFKRAGVKEYGVCGIDLSDVGQLSKVAAAIECGKQRP